MQRLFSLSNTSARVSNIEANGLRCIWVLVYIGQKDSTDGFRTDLINQSILTAVDFFPKFFSSAGTLVDSGGAGRAGV